MVLLMNLKQLGNCDPVQIAEISLYADYIVLLSEANLGYKIA
jgi:hypothetical protein